MNKATIIIRAKNEERWIGKTLSALKTQSFGNFDVVLVDNQSSDNTINIFKYHYPDSKILNIDTFKPGMAINIGVKSCNTEYVIILSAHCIPVGTEWLACFLGIMKDPSIGAAYGRQVPLPSSHPLDKRDLLNTFGVERRIQKKDSFFHNANSIIRRDVWEKHPFDDSIKHIEDRVWAEKIINDDYHIGYEPEASVYHYHGIYHHQDINRASVISNILTDYTLENGHEMPDIFTTKNGQVLYCVLGCDNGNFNELQELVSNLASYNISNKVCVSLKDEEILVVKNLEVMIDSYKYEEDTTFVEILSNMLCKVNAENYFPDCLVYINLKAIDVKSFDAQKLVDTYFKGSFDSVFYAVSEYSNVWTKKDDNGYHQLNVDYTPHDFKDPVYLARYGKGTVTRSEFIINREFIGSNVAILEITDK